MPGSSRSSCFATKSEPAATPIVLQPRRQIFQKSPQMFLCRRTRLNTTSVKRYLNTAELDINPAGAASSDTRVAPLPTQIGRDSWAVKAAKTEKALRVPGISATPSTQYLESYRSTLDPAKAVKTRKLHSAPTNLHFQAPATSSFHNTQPKMAPSTKPDYPSTSGGHDKPLVVGRTKPAQEPSKNTAAQALSASIDQNVQANTQTSAPSDPAAAATITTPPAAPIQKKEKAPKQPKPSKASPAAAPAAPLSPALIDLRVGHILRCIAHPNADSLFVSTIAMGDDEGADHTQVDEETGQIVRTVCSGLNGLVPLVEMQDRKVVVVANLKPVNMRSIKSAAMVLAASPKVEEGSDPHAADRVVELVQVPEGSEAGDKVYFEGWGYGEGKGPEKQLNPKKKVWEAVQPGFFTREDLVVGFDAEAAEGVEGGKGDLVVEGKGKCFVKTLKGAVVR